MTLPNGDRATVDDSKLIDYVLNPQHPIGRHHARLFSSLLDIGRLDFRRLKQALLSAAASEEATIGQTTPFGTKYEVRFPMDGPRGRYTVLSVWLLERQDAAPRLITCFLE